MFVWGMKVISDKCWNPSLQRKTKNHNNHTPPKFTMEPRSHPIFMPKVFPEPNTSMPRCSWCQNPPWGGILSMHASANEGKPLGWHVFVLCFFVGCGVQYQCQCRMFYISYIQHVYIYTYIYIYSYYFIFTLQHACTIPQQLHHFSIQFQKQQRCS